MMKLLSSIVFVVLLALGNTVVGAQQHRSFTGVSLTAGPTAEGETLILPPDDKVHGMEALITMNGLTHDNPAEKDKYFVVLGNAVVEAFNAVGPKAGITMNSWNVKKEVDVPENNVDGLGGKSWWANFWSWTKYIKSGKCNDCGDDSYSWDSPPIEMDIMTFVKTAPETQKKFEKILCRLLRDSGLDTFAGVHDCKVVYLHKPHDDGPSTSDGTDTAEE